MTGWRFQVAMTLWRERHDWKADHVHSTCLNATAGAIGAVTGLRAGHAAALLPVDLVQVFFSSRRLV